MASARVPLSVWERPGSSAPPSTGAVRCLVRAGLVAVFGHRQDLAGRSHPRRRRWPRRRTTASREDDGQRHDEGTDEDDHHSGPGREAVAGSRAPRRRARLGGGLRHGGRSFTSARQTWRGTSRWRVAPLCQVRGPTGSDPAGRRSGRSSRRRSGPRLAGGLVECRRRGMRVHRLDGRVTTSLSSSHVVRWVPRPLAAGAGSGPPTVAGFPALVDRHLEPAGQPGPPARGDGGEQRGEEQHDAGDQGGPRPRGHLGRRADDPGPAQSRGGDATERLLRVGERRDGQGHGPGGGEDQHDRRHATHHRTAGERGHEGDEADEGQRDDAGSHLRTGGRHDPAAEERIGGPAGEPGPGGGEEQDEGRHRDRDGDRRLPVRLVVVTRPRRHDPPAVTRPTPRRRPRRRARIPEPPVPPR